MDRIGLSCALSTPFRADGGVDLPRMSAHARDVLKRGCDSVTLFGTTGEGASIGLGERNLAMGAVVAEVLDPARQLIVGITASTVEEAVAQARGAYAVGCRAIMLAPPFYFGQCSDEGLFGFFRAVFDALGRDLRDVILYHIPGVTRNAISIPLTKRLMAAYPGKIIGIKDSHGDWNATLERLAQLPELQILVGDERQLAQAVQKGAAGAICGLANLAPEFMRPLAHAGKPDIRVNEMVEAILGHSFMPAIKAMLAEGKGDAEWRRMRPPLMALDLTASRDLFATLSAIRSGRSA